ncbi:F0F1 ATP synthase subunit alpha [candidate division WWE3 bacterium CG10_big_fil_rev_8_21_14_0_10_32_10]|uniref:F0F1 ATP synthase subunit alpha n=1 Tax=candidate division WWE3 bacterium CG10_big_fil_rev_8_21_14_0_10_32_10 TaxID=1975090 RepID=A0A2H0RB13_UNCKA|nr:MAG: F0F1 ATP synthase subunit alpha [candidate division WWE3 bacterium CG10_big_fil_rev_8_21_14_0_10_32_10]
MKSKKLYKTNENVKEIGHVFSYYNGVAKVKGLPNVFLNEVLLNDTGESVALVIGFDNIYVETLFFDENYDSNKPLYRSNQIFSIPISKNYLGRVVDGLGRSKDDLGNIQGELKNVYSQAPNIINREPVFNPINTGIKTIDVNLPIGRGQRELIIGDKKLGKSTLALDIVLNQKESDKPVYCVYVLCGQKKRFLEELLTHIKQNQSNLYTVVVAATAEDSLLSQYMAPFVGCTIAEYFRDTGNDALIVYDDLSKHAKVYRTISLLLERSPGREAYPGDIFYLHAGLLERSCKLSKKLGGGSLTALPIIQTEEGDITSFIPTNLISITDGQIYLERGLFQKGFLPAVNVGLSVSRVGSKVQPKLLKKVTGGLRLSLAQHKQLQKLVQLETNVSTDTAKKIYRGELITELLKQDKNTNVTWPEQVVLFYMVENGFFDDLEKEKWGEFEHFLLRLINGRYKQVLISISKEVWDTSTEEQINNIAQDFKQEFLSS